MFRRDPQFSDLLAARVAEAATPAAVAALALRTDSSDVADLIARNACGVPLSHLASRRVTGNPTGNPTSDPTGIRLGAGRTGAGDPRWMLALARVVGLRRSHPDPLTALALFDEVSRRHGWSAFDQESVTVHAQLRARLDPVGLDELLRHATVPPEHRWAVELDAINPFIGRGASIDAWTERLAGLFASAGLEPVCLSGDAARPFDRLQATATSSVDDDALVSVIMSAYRPDRGIVAAARSVLDQSWSNLELLIVDDASPPEFGAVLADVAAMDERVRVLRAGTNGGTYAARNLALEHARGEFVTFQDSDDWTHPRRIERQVEALRADPSRLATRSRAIRAFPDLTFTYVGYAPGRLNASSLLFRRQPVLDSIGYFDAVRKSADIEFPERLRAVAPGSVHDMVAPEPLAICQLRHGSLSRGDAIPGWMDWRRIAYRDSFRAGHTRIRAGDGQAYHDGDPDHRTLPLPDTSWALRPVAAEATPRYDVVVQADWRRGRGFRQSIVAEIMAMQAAGLRVGVCHAETHDQITRNGARERLSTPIQQLINNGSVDFVHVSQQLHTDVLLVHDPSSLQLVPDGEAGMKLDTLAVLVASGTRSGAVGRSFHVPDCDANAQRRFGTVPMWVPRDRRAAAVLSAPDYRPHVSDTELPVVYDATRMAVQVRRPRPGRPVIGRHVTDRPRRWPESGSDLRLAYPDDPAVDVRIMGGHRTPLKRFGSDRLPANWVSFADDQMDTRTFLAQLDFFVYVPSTDDATMPGTAALDAIASGCVVVVPPRFRDDLGASAVYREAADVRDVVASLHSSPAAFAEQQDRARAWLDSRHGPTAFQTALLGVLGR